MAFHLLEMIDSGCQGCQSVGRVLAYHEGSLGFNPSTEQYWHDSTYQGGGG